MVYSDPNIDIKNLIENGYIVVVDTNILLGMYRYSPDYANFALKCLDKVKLSTMLPDAVVIEFQKHHSSMY